MRSQKSDPNSGLLPTECGYSSLNERDKLYYHSYDYAWRLVRFQDDNQSSPIDPQGKYFDRNLVDLAGSLYSVRPRQTRITPADDPRFSPDDREHFLRQDKERAALRLQVQVHGERNANGDTTPEMEAFMACCTRQVHANRLAFLERNRRAARRDPLEQIREAMGVRAVEE